MHRQAAVLTAVVTHAVLLAIVPAAPQPTPTAHAAGEAAMGRAAVPVVVAEAPVVAQTAALRRPLVAGAQVVAGTARLGAAPVVKAAMGVAPKPSFPVPV